MKEDKDNLIGKKIKSEPRSVEDTSEISKRSFDNIVNAGIAETLDISKINSLTQVSQSRDNIYKILDIMSEDPTIAAVLETYAEDATEYNEQGKILWVESDDGKIIEFINYLINTLQIDKNIYRWVYDLCKYGDIYLELFRKSDYDKDMDISKQLLDKDSDEKETKKLEEDVKINVYSKNDPYIHYIENKPNPAEMFELIRFGKTAAYIEADIPTTQPNTTKDILNQQQMIYRYASKDVNIYDSSKFVHGALEDNSTRTPEELVLYKNTDKTDKDKKKEVIFTVKRGQSLLYNVYKIWRELSLLENSILLNRVTKSSITRVVSVEVGEMPKEMVGPHLQGIKSLIEQKSSLNENNSMSEYTNPGPIENNIYVPTKNGVGALSTSQIGGDVNVGQLPDIEYFQNKFFGALRIPKQYFGLTSDNAGFSGGQSLAIISSRYAKMIKRIQSTMIQTITDAFNLFLIDKGLNSYINKFKLKMQPPTTQEEIDRRDNLASKVQIVSDIMNTLSEIDDKAKKLSILKSLLATIITDNDVIKLIEEEISKLNVEEDETSDIANEQNTSIEDSNYDTPLNLNQDTEQAFNMDSELGLEDTDNNQENSSLPTPEETGVDLTNNNSEI